MDLHATTQQDNAHCIEPEWLRVKQAVRFSSIGKSTLADLIARGKIKSHLVRARGNVSGIRLISVASLRAYIQGGAGSEEPAPDPRTAWQRSSKAAMPTAPATDGTSR